MEWRGAGAVELTCMALWISEVWSGTGIDVFFATRSTAGSKAIARGLDVTCAVVRFRGPCRSSLFFGPFFWEGQGRVVETGGEVFWPLQREVLVPSTGVAGQIF